MGSPLIPILFITSPEYGQANVVLAAAQEVAASPDHQVHVASYEPLRKRIEDINLRNKSLARPLRFICIPGVSAGTAAQRQLGDTSKWAHPSGVRNAAKSYKAVEYLLMGDSPSEYLLTYRACLGIVDDLKPAAVVVDILIIAAHDAVRAHGLDYIIILPCSPKEGLGSAMPGMPMMLKWPQQSSGLSYPLSIWQMIQNIYLFLCFAYSVLLGPTFTRIRQARKEAGISHQSPIFGMYQKYHLFIAPHLPEADWDELRNTPSNLVTCGPIVMPTLQDDSETSADLLKWISQRPTILVNLGSLHGPLGASSLAIAKGLQIVLEYNKNVQILWKLKYDWADDAEIATTLRPCVASGRLRLVPWLDIEPSALLDTGHICCSVHHGGANAFYEACRAGVPHVVLPIWWDTYEYAERVKYHCIGAIGNVGVAPTVEPRQFSSKLLGVLSNEDIKRRAAEIRAVCKRRGEGRSIAAAAIIDWARKGKSKPKDGKYVAI